MAKNPPAKAGDAKDAGSIPRFRSPGRGNGNPIQYSCLTNPIDREARWAALHWVSKSRTQLGTHARRRRASSKPIQRTPGSRKPRRHTPSPLSSLVLTTTLQSCDFDPPFFQDMKLKPQGSRHIPPEAVTRIQVACSCSPDSTKGKTV